MSDFEVARFKFLEECSVPTARDPQASFTIPTGIWNVVFDDMISRPGNTDECQIERPNISSQRILRSSLIDLVKSGQAQRI